MPYKRVDLLIAAFAEVRERVPDAVLCIAGSGPAEAGLRELVRSLRLDEAVTFEGFVDERRKRELLQSAWAFCNPSEMEGWGISIIEANACATPAVAFAVPGLREAILDGESGMLVPEGGELAKPIVRLLTDAPWRLRLEEGAKKRASAFSWDRTADAMLEQVVQVVTGDWFGLERTTKRWSLMKKRSVNGQSERGSPVTESIPIDVIY
jgi:glycosyltransferase involved in cell wall biosynthesis